MLQSSMPKSRVAPGYMQRAGAIKQHHIAGFIFKTTTKVKFREKVPQTASPQQKGCYETLLDFNQALIRLIQLELAYVLGCVCFYNVLNKVDLC